MNTLRATAMIAALAISACSGAVTPTSSPSSPSPSPVAERSPTPQPSAPVPTATALPASPSPAPEPWPGGRLSYGRFGSSGVTPLTSNTDGTDEQQLLPPSAEGPSWSPNGLLIAVALESPQGLLGTGIVKPDGSDLVRFDSPDSTLNLGCTLWSPDGSRLACEAWDETDPTRNGMYTVRSTDGGDLRRVTAAPEDRSDIPGDYTLDGSQILFCRAAPEGVVDDEGGRLMVVNVDGRDEHTLSDQPMCGGKLSPDGTTILTDSGNFLTLVPAEGGPATPIHIAEAPNDLALRGAWSPDGEWIVFSLYRSNAPHSDIYIMRKDGTDLRQVTDTPNQDEEFSDWTAAPQAGGVIKLEMGCKAGVARCEHMPAGTYETSGEFAFLPGLRVTLPADWSSAEQDAGEFMLHQASDVNQASAIFFWRDLVPWVEGVPRPDLGTSAGQFVDHLLGDARLTVVEGPRRTFAVRRPDPHAVAAPVEARSLTVIVSPSAESDADMSDCPGEACVNLFIDPDHWDRAASLGRNIDAPVAGCPCSQAWHLYVVAIGGDVRRHLFVVALEAVGPDPLASLSAWEAVVEPIIASVQVPYTVIDN